MKNLRLLCIVATFFLSSCGLSTAQGSTGSSGKQPAVYVELDVYSGRPNPDWALSPQEMAELATRLKALQITVATPEDGGLGYRGFLIKNPEGASGIASHIQVFQGVVTLNEKGQATSYTDNQGIEQWLEAQARAHGQDAILKALGK